MMRLPKTLLFGLCALAAQVIAQSATLQFTNVPSALKVGETYTLKYKAPTDDPCTIILRKGTSNNLQTIATLTTTAVGGSFEWCPGSQLEDGADYALEIKQGDQVNYYGPFSCTGGGPAGITSSYMTLSKPSSMPGKSTTSCDTSSTGTMSEPKSMSKSHSMTEPTSKTTGTPGTTDKYPPGTTSPPDEYSTPPSTPTGHTSTMTPGQGASVHVPAPFALLVGAIGLML